MSIIGWLILGLIAGFIASKLYTGSGSGLVINIILGIVGAFVGGWLFSRMGWHSPFAGLAGTIFVAFIGAVVLLFIVRLLTSYRRVP